MITYLKGKLLKKEEDRIVVLVNGVGYDVRLPYIVRQTYKRKKAGQDGEEVELFVSYQQSERQPKPLLIGFNFEVEREFFEKFIEVEDIGPIKAVRALTMPIPKIARAIEERDVKTLKTLNGIGARTAEKVVASLNGKVGKFALMKEDMIEIPEEPEDLKRQVQEVLVKQLGHKQSEANRMVDEAIKRKPDVSTAEELFEEVYRGQRT